MALSVAHNEWRTRRRRRMAAATVHAITDDVHLFPVADALLVRFGDTPVAGALLAVHTLLISFCFGKKLLYRVEVFSRRCLISTR